MKPAILIADGDERSAQHCNHLLQSQGYHVETVHRVQGCLSRLLFTIPELLLLHWDLPAGGAESVLVWMREEQTQRRLPTVLLSGTASTEQIAGFLVPPVGWYLPKPFADQELMAVLRSILYPRRHRATLPIRGPRLHSSAPIQGIP